jgi:hypothetical protein
MSLFGKYKKMDTGLINQAYAPYDAMVSQQATLAKDLMDPGSIMNRQRQDLLRRNQMDMLATQNQGLIGMAAQQGTSPAQLHMQQLANKNTSLGNFTEQMQNMYGQQFQQGLGLFGQAAAGYQGIGDRLSNVHMQEVNAHNAAIDRRKNTTMQLVGMGLNLAAPFFPTPKT